MVLHSMVVTVVATAVWMAVAAAVTVAAVVVAAATVALGTMAVVAVVVVVAVARLLADSDKTGEDKMVYLYLTILYTTYSKPIIPVAVAGRAPPASLTSENLT